jgi:LysM repeat protein
MLPYVPPKTDPRNPYKLNDPYLVRPGDTLSQLSEMFKVGAQQLLSYNGIQSLSAGARIKIPAPTLPGPPKIPASVTGILPSPAAQRLAQTGALDPLQLPQLQRDPRTGLPRGYGGTPATGAGGPAAFLSQGLGGASIGNQGVLPQTAFQRRTPTAQTSIGQVGSPVTQRENIREGARSLARALAAGDFSTISSVPIASSMMVGFSNSQMTDLGFVAKLGAWVRPTSTTSQPGSTGGGSGPGGSLNQEEFQRRGGGTGARWWIGGGGLGGGRNDLRAQRAAKPKGRGSGDTATTGVNLNVGT